MTLAAVVSVFILALAAPGLHRWMPRRSGWILGLLPLALTVFFASKIPLITAGEVITEFYDWVPGLGANLSFYLDGLSLVFALLICGVGTLIVIYSGGYLAGDPHLGRFYTFLLFFMASMLGLVLAGNLISLFVFWELTSISSYFLIGFDLWLGPIVPALLGLILGLFPNLLTHSPVSSAVSVVLVRPLNMHLALWHGFAPMFALSALERLDPAILDVSNNPKKIQKTTAIGTLF